MKSIHRILIFGSLAVASSVYMEIPSALGAPPIATRRAALNRWWTTKPAYDASAGGLGGTTVDLRAGSVVADGADLWVAGYGSGPGSGTVTRVRASDGKRLEAWTGVGDFPTGVLAAAGRVFAVAQRGTVSALYMIDPSEPVGDATLVANLLPGAGRLAYDGRRIWTLTNGVSLFGPNTVTIVTPGPTIPWSTFSTSTGFGDLEGLQYDGTSMWVSDAALNTVFQLDPSGAIVRSVAVGAEPFQPAFDGRNLWVPNGASNSISIVQVTSGHVIATLSGNGLSFPFAAAFDGERIMVVGVAAGRGVFSLWRADSMAPVVNYPAGTAAAPGGICSDGIDFWVTIDDATFSAPAFLARY